MGANTAISWTDHTFNAWWGCAKVSPACNACYAEAWAKRTGFTNLWGTDAERRTFGDKHWNEPLKWDREAAAAGKRMRVFTNSMADVFDNHPAVDMERWRLWDLIEMTPNLDWLLLTKRIGNAMGMFPKRWLDARDRLPRNIWLGATVVNQQEADRDVRKLLSIPAAVRFLSCEPLLGHIDLLPWLGDIKTGFGVEPGVHWVIVGGESGPGARPMHPKWARSLRDQCVGMGVAYHFKQWGEWAPHSPQAGGDLGGDIRKGRVRIVHPSGRSDVEIAEATGGHGTEPGSRYMAHIGKKQAGRLLDGRAWDEVPNAPR